MLVSRFAARGARGRPVERMRKREIERLQNALDERRKALLVKSVRTASEGRASVSEGGEDYVDDAVNSYTREFLLSLSSLEQKQLGLVEEALERIEDGTYGECDNCGEDIGLARLKAIPWAQNCVRCQEDMERESGGPGAPGPARV